MDRVWSRLLPDDATTTGRDLTDVQADLGAIGLASSVEEEFSDDVQSGIVTHSNPDGGSSVHKSTNVQLYVSKGIDMKDVQTSSERDRTRPRVP